MNKILKKINIIIKEVIAGIKVKYKNYKAGEPERQARRFEKEMMRLERRKMNEILRGQKLELKAIRENNNYTSQTICQNKQNRQITNNNPLNFGTQPINNNPLGFKNNKRKVNDPLGLRNNNKKVNTNDPLGLNYGNKKRGNINKMLGI